MKKEGFRDTDTCGGVEKRRNRVVLSVFKHDFVEERGFAIATGTAVFGVLIIVESVVGGLTEVATSEDEFTEGEI